MTKVVIILLLCSCSQTKSLPEATTQVAQTTTVEDYDSQCRDFLGVVDEDEVTSELEHDLIVCATDSSVVSKECHCEQNDVTPQNHNEEPDENGCLSWQAYECAEFSYGVWTKAGEKLHEGRDTYYGKSFATKVITFEKRKFFVLSTHSSDSHSTEWTLLRPESSSRPSLEVRNGTVDVVGAKVIVTTNQGRQQLVWDEEHDNFCVATGNAFDCDTPVFINGHSK